MKIRYIYEFYEAAWSKPREVLEIESPLFFAVGHSLKMAKLSTRSLTIHKVEHHLAEQVGVVVCKTCIHCR